MKSYYNMYPIKCGDSAEVQDAHGEQVGTVEYRDHDINGPGFLAKYNGGTSIGKVNGTNIRIPVKDSQGVERPLTVTHEPGTDRLIVLYLKNKK